LGFFLIKYLEIRKIVKRKDTSKTMNFLEKSFDIFAGIFG